MGLEAFEHLLNSYGLPLAAMALFVWASWAWGFNRSDNEKTRGYFTKLADRRLVTEERTGEFMEVASSFMASEQKRLEEDGDWKRRQVEQCGLHVSEIARLKLHQEQQNKDSASVISELKTLNRNIYDSDGIAGPAKRLELSVQEMSSLALELFQKPWNELTEDERHRVRAALEKVVERHSRTIV